MSIMKKEKKKKSWFNITLHIKIKKKKKDIKRMWLLAIRNFDIYIYIYIKWHQRRNYQINGDIYGLLK